MLYVVLRRDSWVVEVAHHAPAGLAGLVRRRFIREVTVHTLPILKDDGPRRILKVHDTISALRGVGSRLVRRLLWL